MEEGRKSSLSYQPAALPKPFVPRGCASIGIVAAPLSESLLVKHQSGPDLGLSWPARMGLIRGRRPRRGKESLASGTH
jgi:hypothetical protein